MKISSESIPEIFTDAARSSARPSPEHSMSEMPPGLPKHPIGTFAFVAAYAVLFVCAWFAVYYLIFMARQPVTP